MRARLRWLWLVAAVVAGIWAWHIFFPDPQKIITARLQKLAACVSFAPGDGNFKRLTNIQKMESLFAENVQVTVGVTGEGSHAFAGRAELMAAAAAARTALSSLNVKIIDVSVLLNPGGASATADVMVNVRIGEEKDLVAEPLEFTFQKTNDDWLITRVETVQALR